MPSDHVEFEVQQIIEHCDDLDNVRWYSARLSDGHVQWLTEADASNWLYKVKEYFARVGISAKRPARASKKGRKKSQKTNVKTSKKTDSHAETEKQSEKLWFPVKESRL